jgi:hypothetical protein
MAKGATFDNQLLKLIFNATNIANIADNTATSPLTNLYLSLHTADPTSAGNQTSSEVSYTGYARVAVARSTSGWTVSGNSVNPAATISWPACTGGTATATNFGIGTASTGTGELLYSGTISPNIAIASGVTPQLTTATSITES